MITAISHVALRVVDTAEAESYYCRLFDLRVAFRDLTLDGLQQSLRPGVTWQAAKRAGVTPGLSFLWRDNFNLAIEQAEANAGGLLDHLGLQVDEGDISSTLARARQAGSEVLQHRTDLLVFHDRYGIRWELTATSYDAPDQQSTGPAWAPGSTCRVRRFGILHSWPSANPTRRG